MSREERARRDYVASMYPGPKWKERVAHMPYDQVVALYLKFIRDGQKPKPEPEDDRDIRDDKADDEQLGLF